jgi:hypothetical protein
MITPPPKRGGGSTKGAPSGFVMKLFQMVNGAEDDIVSVSEDLEGSADEEIVLW